MRQSLLSATEGSDDALTSKSYLQLAKVENELGNDSQAETYVMEAVPSPQGIYCFRITLKYPNEENEAALRTRAMAEESALRSYNNIRRRVVGTDFAAELSVIFYDAAGQVLGTWEQELWNSFPGGADR